MPYYQCTPNYHAALRERKLVETVNRMSNMIDDWLASDPGAKDVTHLVFTGISGQSIGWPVAVQLMSRGIDIQPAAIRKPNEKSHGYTSVVAEGQMRRFIILDDFIASGDTIRRIIDTIKEEATGHRSLVPECAAVFLFHSDKNGKPWNYSLCEGKLLMVPVYGEDCCPGW